MKLIEQSDCNSCHCICPASQGEANQSVHKPYLFETISDLLANFMDDIENESLSFWTYIHTNIAWWLKSYITLVLVGDIYSYSTGGPEDPSAILF